MPSNSRGFRVPNCVRMLVWIAMIVLVVAASRLDAGLGLRLPGPRLLYRAAGLLLLLVVLRGAAVTGRYLAVYGRSGPHVPRGEPDQLVTVGPYSCMRHPMHLFLSLFPVSVALLLASPASLLVAAAEAAMVLVLAVTVDERESLSRFGEEYRRYRERVPAFNPSPRCLWLGLARRPPKRRMEPGAASGRLGRRGSSRGHGGRGSS